MTGDECQEFLYNWVDRFVALDKLIDVLTYNASDVTLSADTTYSGVNRFRTLDLAGYTYVADGQPHVIIAYSITNGTIDKTTTGGAGGAGGDDNYIEDGGGGGATGGGGGSISVDNTTYSTYEDLLKNILNLPFNIGILITDPQHLPYISRLPLIHDNGAYKGKLLSFNQLLNIIDYIISKNLSGYVILPDSIENPEETIEMHVKFLKELEPKKWKYTIPVLQGKSIQDYFKCWKLLKERIGYQNVGKYFRIVAIGGLKLKKPKERIEIVTKLAPELSKKIKGYSLKIHVLGADLTLIEECFDKVHSFDSANWTYNSTTGHGLTIIDELGAIQKVNIYLKEIKDWETVLMNEVIKWLMSILLRLSTYPSIRIL